MFIGGDYEGHLSHKAENCVFKSFMLTKFELTISYAILYLCCEHTIFYANTETKFFYK